jgi:hypothetical protein
MKQLNPQQASGLVEEKFYKPGLGARGALSSTPGNFLYWNGIFLRPPAE